MVFVMITTIYKVYLMEHLVAIVDIITEFIHTFQMDISNRKIVDKSDDSL